MVSHDDSLDIAARVRALRMEADGVMSVELAAASGSLPAWEPGAHIDLVAPGAPVRQYSLCGDPAEPFYRIAVLRESDSRGGSRFVHETLRPGDEVVIRGPRNHFALEPAAEYLFIAGGIGITPMLPMVRAAAATGARWRLVYLGSERSRMPFVDDLTALGGDIRLAPRDEVGRADLVEEIAAHPDALVYACGPERMLSALRDVIPDDASGNGRLRYEYFAAPVVEYEPGGPFVIRLETTGLDVEVDPDTSVLEALRSVGIEILSDCEEGICGSCETHVISGEIEHRDFVLTAQEKERNDCMMVCVSRAACPLLVLDA